MAIRKPGTPVAEAPAAALPGASQVTSAAPVAVAPKVDYAARDAQKIRGQVRMHAILAALQSPAGPAFSPTAEGYETWVTKMADIAVAYTFAEETK
jgi:hypothetical protein